MRYRLTNVILIVISVAGFASCKSGSMNLFKAGSPHEIYQRKLVSAGLDKTAIGSEWINMASGSLKKPLIINIPYRETGYFSAENASATAYRFTAIKGEKIQVSIVKKPAEAAVIYTDIWFEPAGGTGKLLASADTLGNNIALEIENTGSYLIRLQPELLRSAGYTLEVTSGPSLGFPTKTGRNNIQSFWGDGRDDNHRKHEGVDIFGKFRSPVLATNDGTVTRVNENNLGGKVVWFRPKGKDYTLYYAHLDEQIAKEGQEVLAGDTLGLMGNTGNARTTLTHLHFGVYTFGGAVDPLPFINPVVKAAAKVTAPVSTLNKTFRTLSKVTLRSASDNRSPVLTQIAGSTVVKITSATADWYKVELPDGERGFLKSTEVIQASKPLRKIGITTSNVSVYDKPDSVAAVKLNLNTGEKVDLLGNFGNYSLINTESSKTGWIKKLP